MRSVNNQDNSIIPLYRLIQGRGSSFNPANRFDKTAYHACLDENNPQEQTDIKPSIPTKTYPDKNKTLINFIKGNPYFFDRSINPYRGCEHGCIYCYARPSHCYLGLSAGLDFESKIFYKTNVQQQLEKELCKPSYRCKPIVLGSNTDPYQPLEAKLKITQTILETLLRFKHPVRILTRSGLIMRDLELLKKMAKLQLVSVGVSITTTDEKMARLMEPRAMTIKNRLSTLAELTKHLVPTVLMIAPIIPLINDHEIEHILEAGHAASVQYAFYSWLRLEHELPTLFSTWAHSTMGHKAPYLIKSVHQLINNDPAIDWRKKLLAQRFANACKKLGIKEPLIDLDCSKFNQVQSPQLLLSIKT